MEEKYCRCPGCGECGGAKRARELAQELEKTREGAKIAFELGREMLGTPQDPASSETINKVAYAAVASLRRISRGKASK